MYFYETLSKRRSGEVVVLEAGYWVRKTRKLKCWHKFHIYRGNVLGEINLVSTGAFKREAKGRVEL